MKKFHIFLLFSFVFVGASLDTEDGSGEVEEDPDLVKETRLGSVRKAVDEDVKVDVNDVGVKVDQEAEESAGGAVKNVANVRVHHYRVRDNGVVHQRFHRGPRLTIDPGMRPWLRWWLDRHRPLQVPKYPPFAPPTAPPKQTDQKKFQQSKSGNFNFLQGLTRRPFAGFGRFPQSIMELEKQISEKIAKPDSTVKQVYPNGDYSSRKGYANGRNAWYYSTPQLNRPNSLTPSHIRDGSVVYLPDNPFNFRRQDDFPFENGFNYRRGDFQRKAFAKKQNSKDEFPAESTFHATDSAKVYQIVLNNPVFNIVNANDLNEDAE